MSSEFAPETGRPQLSGTQFDKIKTTRYEYWQVLSPSLYFVIAWKPALKRPNRHLKKKKKDQKDENRHLSAETGT